MNSDDVELDYEEPEFEDDNISMGELECVDSDEDEDSLRKRSSSVTNSLAERNGKRKRRHRENPPKSQPESSEINFSVTARIDTSVKERLSTLRAQKPDPEPSTASNHSIDRDEQRIASVADDGKHSNDARQNGKTSKDDGESATARARKMAEFFERRQREREEVDKTSKEQPAEPGETTTKDDVSRSSPPPARSPASPIRESPPPRSRHSSRRVGGKSYRAELDRRDAPGKHSSSSTSSKSRREHSSSSIPAQKPSTSSPPSSGRRAESPRRRRDDTAHKRRSPPRHTTNGAHRHADRRANPDGRSSPASDEILASSTADDNKHRHGAKRRFLDDLSEKERHSHAARKEKKKKIAAIEEMDQRRLARAEDNNDDDDASSTTISRKHRQISPPPKDHALPTVASIAVVVKHPDSKSPQESAKIVVRKHRPISPPSRPTVAAQTISPTVTTGKRTAVDEPAPSATTTTRPTTIRQRITFADSPASLAHKSPPHRSSSPPPKAIRVVVQQDAESPQPQSVGRVPSQSVRKKIEALGKLTRVVVQSPNAAAALPSIALQRRVSLSDEDTEAAKLTQINRQLQRAENLSVPATRLVTNVMATAAATSSRQVATLLESSTEQEDADGEPTRFVIQMRSGWKKRGRGRGRGGFYYSN